MPFFKDSERCPEILNYTLVSYLSFLVDEQDERYIYYEIFQIISGGLVWVKTFRSDSVSLRMKKATLRTRLDTLNNPNNGQSTLNLDPRLIFCRLKWRWIAFQKAMKCYLIDVMVSLMTLISFKSKNENHTQYTPLKQSKKNEIHTLFAPMLIHCPEVI